MGIPDNTVIFRIAIEKFPAQHVFGGNLGKSNLSS